MRCKDEAQIISTLEGQQLKIASIHLLKFGTITISNNEPSDEPPHPFSDRSEFDMDFDDDGGLAASKKLAEIIEAHANIFDFKVVGKTFPPSEHISLGAKLIHGPIYRASVHLPKKQQKYQDMDCDEHFSVLLAGTYFAAFTRVRGLATYSNMAHEFREIFRSQVVDRTSWKAPLIGPCPIHQDLFIVGVKSSLDSRLRREPLLYVVGDSLFVVVAEDAIEETIEDLFDDCLIYLSAFYELALARIELIFIDTEIENRMDSLVEAHNGFASTPAWKFKTVQRFLTAAREHLARIYELRVKHSRGVASYKRSRQSFLDRLRESTWLEPLRNALKEDTIMDVELPKELLPSIQFFQAQADAKRGSYSILLASLVGALIGGFLTFAATLFRVQR